MFFPNIKLPRVPDPCIPFNYFSILALFGTVLYLSNGFPILQTIQKLTVCHIYKELFLQSILKIMNQSPRLPSHDKD